MHSILLSAKDMGASQVLSSGLATQNLEVNEERPQRLQTNEGENIDEADDQEGANMQERKDFMLAEFLN